MLAARSLAIGVIIAAMALSGCSSDAGVPLADGSDSSVQAAIKTVTTFPSQLDPRLWNGTDLKSEVRQ